MADIKLNTTNGSVTLKPEDGSGNVDITVPRAGVGKVLQVVRNQGLSYTTTSSTTYVGTHLTLNITPKSPTSSILIVAEGTVYTSSANSGAGVYLKRNESTILANGGHNMHGYVNATGNHSRMVLSWMDTPNTTNSTQYRIWMNSYSATGAVDLGNGGNSVSSITAYEIGA